MAEDFMSGMKDAMSIYTMMSLSSNYLAQQENMAGNREMREQNIQRLTAEDQRQELTSDTALVQLASDPKKNLPNDVALPLLNRIAAKPQYGGNLPISTTQYNEYLGKLDQFTNRTDLPTSEARRVAFQPLADEAASHVGYTRAFNQRADTIHSFIDKPAVHAAFAASGFTPTGTENLLANLKPSEAMGLLKDNDWRKAAIYNQASETTRKVANGETVPEGELQQVLTAAHGAGFKIGADAADIVKGTTGEMQYNLAQKDVDSLNKTTVTPLSKMWKMLPEDKLIQTVARNVSSGPSLISVSGGGPEEVIAKMLPPQMSKPFMESVAKMEAVNTQATKQYQDFQTRYKIAKANPGTTPADQILLDQQMLVERSKAAALTEPFKRYNAFLESPTSDNYKGVLNASDHLDTTIRRWETDKSKLLTVSEQATNQQIAEGKLKMGVGQGTNDAQAQLIDQMQAQGVTRDQEQKVRELAAPIIKNVNEKYGVKIDVDELLKGFRPEGSLNIKFPGEGERKDIAETKNLLEGYKMVEALYDPSYVGMVEGKLGSVKEATGAIGQQQADFYQGIDTIARQQRKFFGGVAVTPTELKLLLSTVVNRGMSDQQFQSSVRVNKIILGGDAKAKIDVLKELGFKTPAKTAAAIDEALEKAKSEVQSGNKTGKGTTSSNFTMENFMALQKAHPEWSPAQIGAAAARGEQ
jgi:hypothetical protein